MGENVAAGDRAEENRRAYLRRKERCLTEGLCFSCRRRKHATGKLRCGTCAAGHADVLRTSKALLPFGTCMRCRKVPATPGMTRCDPCREKNRAECRAAYRARRKAAAEQDRTCNWCRKARASPGKSWCLPCRKRNRAAACAAYARRKAGAG